MKKNLLIHGFSKGLVKKKIAQARAHSSISGTVPRSVTVGIWSLDAWLGNITGLISGLSNAQRSFVFFEIDAVVPVGLINRPEGIAARLPPDILKQRDIHDMRDNMLSNDFFPLAERVRKDLGLDYLIGVTPSMVAGEEGQNYFWNYFSTFDKHTVLVSSYGLHTYAKETGHSLEAFLASIIVSQLLVATSWPVLGYHDDTGCLFDFDESRQSLKEKVHHPKIDADCIKLVKARYRTAANEFVKFLSTL